MTTDMSHPTADTRLSRRFIITAWRWHFYAGLFVAPFLIMLALTGLVMLWSSVLVGRDGEKAFTVAPSGPLIAVSRQAALAASAVPGGSLVQAIMPRHGGEPAVFRFDAAGRAVMVAIDPYRGTVLGTWARDETLYDIANRIHGTLLIGTVGDRLIEIAAGFAVVLIVTGAYLWWPRDRRLAGPSRGGRAGWASLHRTVGISAAALLLVFLVSGLSWSGIWGERLTQAWSTFPAAKYDDIPISDLTHASLNPGGQNTGGLNPSGMDPGGVKDVPWALEQTPMPASDPHAAHEGHAMGMAEAPGDVDAIVARARALGFDGRFQLSFPGSETGVWTIARDTMSSDSPDPTSDRTVHIDRYSGRVLADIGFGDYGAAGKAMAVGVAFHEGDIGGGWNVALNTALCLAVIVLSASGTVMWWMRRPKGAGRLVAPAVPGPMPVWKTGAAIMIAVSLLFPLTGIALVCVLALDLLIVRRLKPVKRMLS